MSFDTQKQQGDRARVGKQLKQREHQRSVRVDTVPSEGIALWRMRHRRYDRLANKSIRKATAASTASFDGQLSSSPSSRRSSDHHTPNWTFLISTRTINRIVEAEMETIHREFTAAVATAQSHPPIVEATRTHVPVRTNPLATAGWAYTSRDAYNGCRTLLEWGGRPLQQHQQQPDSHARSSHRRNDALQIFQQAAVVRSICHKAEACEPTDMHRQHLVLEACRALGKVDSRTDPSRAQLGPPSRLRGMVITRKSLRLLAEADFDCGDFGDSDEAEECEQRFGEAAQPGGEWAWSPELQPLPAVASASEDENDTGSDADEFVLIDHRDAQALGAVGLTAAAGAEERSVLEADMAEQEEEQASSPPSGPIVLDLQQLLAKSKRASKRKMPAQQQHWQHLARHADDGQQEPQHEEWPELRARPVDADAFVIV